MIKVKYLGNGLHSKWHFEKSIDNGLVKCSQLSRGFLRGQNPLPFIPAPGVERFGSDIQHFKRGGGVELTALCTTQAILLAGLLQCQTALLESCARRILHIAVRFDCVNALGSHLSDGHALF